MAGVPLPALVRDQLLHELQQTLTRTTNSQVHILAIHTHTPAACGNGSVPAFLVYVLSCDCEVRSVGLRMVKHCPSQI